MIHLFFGPLFLGISLAAPVGPINLEMMKRGIKYGFWHSWLVGLGGMSADIGLMLLIYFGVSHYLTAEPVQVILLLLGSVMLGLIGFQSMNMCPQIETAQNLSKQTKSLYYAYGAGLLIAGVNPINLIFWLGVYGSVLSERLDEMSQGNALLFSCTIFVGVALWNLLMAVTIHFGKGFLGKKGLRWITVTAGLILVAYGCHFGWKGITGLFALSQITTAHMISIFFT